MNRRNAVEVIRNETGIVKMLSSHRKSVLILGLFALLSAGIWLRDQTEAADDAGVVERNAAGGSTQTRTFSFRLGEADEVSGEVNLDVLPVQPDREEAFALLEEAVSEWENVYLRENASANEVREDLVLPTEFCGGLVEASYESSDNSVLHTDGTVETGALTEEGTLAELTAVFACGDYTQIETAALWILPPETGSTEWIYSELEEAAREAEEESREQSSFSLPDSIDGYQVFWEAGEEQQWMYFLLIGVIVVICLEQRDKQAEKEKRKERMAQLEFEYPQMVDRFSVLIDSGMTIRGAWERILKRESYADQGTAGGHRKTDSVFLEEMWITYREIKEGRGEREAYERFGDRIGLMPYKRFSSILAQNLSRGTRDMKDLLRKESLEALEMRKTRARRLGEEAGAKLLFPMLVMLMLILLVLLLPALTSF
ncbi:MAG: hypothetical protein LIO75_04445 [Lachnospiraceae bacterium]|nr:hypothetical protein [Lachnospiraceae bacterium]